VHVLALPNTYAGADTTICPNDTVQLQASGANAYLWFPPIGLSDPTIANPLAVLSTSQTYIVKGFVNANCYTEDTLVITVNPGGSITAPPDVQICRGDSIQLNALGSNIIAWEWSPTDGLSDPNISNPMASPQNTTVYTVTGVTTSGCKVTDMVIVNVIPFTAPVIYGNDACLGQEHFYIYAIKDATCGNAYWFNGSIQDVLSSPGGLSPSNPRFINSADSIPVNASNLGNYVFTLACVNPNTGCIGLDEFDLDVIAYPKASFTSDKTLCTYDDRTVQFTSTSTNAVFHYWQFGDPTTGDLNWDTLPNPVHTFSGPGKYSIALFVMNELGCADLIILDDYIEVTPPNYYFPTAFSPNGDGLNDVFRALPPNSANVLSMKIWDRWGNLVFESKNDNKGWTGYTPDGKPFDPGTYTYKVLIQLPQKSEPTVYTGYVTLIR
jgi:gliding motility-associated-like protein